MVATNAPTTPEVASTADRPVTHGVLVRYGRAGEVGRFAFVPERLEDDPPPRGATVVVETSVGQRLGEVLAAEPVRDEPPARRLLGLATDEDLRSAGKAGDDRDHWAGRVATWGVDVDVIDVERTLDGAVVLFVLADRGPDTTRLALRFAEEEGRAIHVVPLGPDGVPLEVEQAGGGCGSCGCH